MTEPLLRLLDRPENATLIGWLRSQAVLADGRNSEFDLGAYELHTHPDLVDRLVHLGQGSERAITPLFGVPVLVRGGDRPFAVALGTRTLLLRLPAQPADVTRLDVPAELSVGWVAVDAWQSDLASGEGSVRLRAHVRSAFDAA